MLPVTSAARLARLPDRPAAAVARDGRAAAAVAARTPGGWTPRGPARDPGPAARGTYAEAAYGAASAAVAPRPAADETVELSTRLLAGGGRLSVARRTAGGRTLGIEAQVG